MKNILSILFTIAAFSTFAQINFDHEITFQQALDKAKTEGKLVFMDCYTTWCGPCRKLSSETFTDESVGNFFNSRFVNLKMDMEKGEGVELAARFGIRGYPTLLWINPDGSVKYRTMGFQYPEQLLDLAKQADDTLSNKLTVLREKYNNGERDINFLNDYLSTLVSVGGANDTLLKTFMDKLSPSDLQQPKYAKTIFNATNDIHSSGISYVLKNKTLLTIFVGQQTYNQKINTLSESAVNTAIVKKDQAKLNDAFQFMKEAEGKNADEPIAHAQMEFSARINDWKNFDKSATDLVKKYASKNDKALNDIAWKYYFNIDDKKQLEKATQWAHQAVELKNTNDNNTIYAYLNYKLGKLKEAELACDYALLRAKDEGSNDSSPKGLKALIEAEKTKK